MRTSRGISDSVFVYSKESISAEESKLSFLNPKMESMGFLFPLLGFDKFSYAE